eukprot:g31101.t1
MCMEAKTAEEEFNAMCPKFVKVVKRRNKAEAFAEYGAFSIGERKVRRNGQYQTDGRVGRGDGVRGKGRRGRFQRAMGIFESCCILWILMPERKRKKFLVSTTNELEDEVELQRVVTSTGAAVRGPVNIMELSVIVGGFKTRGIHMGRRCHGSVTGVLEVKEDGVDL